jgi:hypothetical protein
LDAARNGPEKQRPLLRKERLAGGNLFSRLATHANGWPVYVPPIVFGRHLPIFFLALGAGFEKDCY